MTLEEISQTFKALSDPIRLQIVYLLIDKESLCVCEIVETLKLNQSTTSRHLAYLKNSNIVTAERHGVWMHYSLQKDSLEFIKLNRISKHLQEVVDIEKKSKNCCTINESSKNP